jgi:hypothetical protein
MARLNISIPDDLRESMEGLNCNWSAVAQEAFAHAVQLEQLKGQSQDQEAGLARLRVDKQRHSGLERAQGFQHGQSWALEDASYDELKSGVQATDAADVDGVVAWVTAQLSATDFDLGLPAKTVGAAYAQGFLEGAADILANV